MTDARMSDEELARISAMAAVAEPRPSYQTVSGVNGYVLPPLPYLQWITLPNTI
jgi:hypothetical protein